MKVSIPHALEPILGDKSDTQDRFEVTNTALLLTLVAERYTLCLLKKSLDLSGVSDSCSFSLSTQSRRFLLEKRDDISTLMPLENRKKTISAPAQGFRAGL